MAKPYSDDLRVRAIAIVEGGASRHEVAALLEVSPSSVINWLRRWSDDGSSAAKPSGGSVSPLEKHAGWLLALITAHPDLTLDEAVTSMRRRRIVGSRSALSRFFIRHDITFEKKLRAAEQARPDVARARRRWIREQGTLNPARLVFIDETAASTKMVRLNGRCPRGVRLIGDAPPVIGNPITPWTSQPLPTAIFRSSASPVEQDRIRRCLRPKPERSSLQPSA